MPTEAYRRGDFSAALTGRQLGTDALGRPIMENAIYDPRTTRTVNVGALNLSFATRSRTTSFPQSSSTRSP